MDKEQARIQRRREYSKKWREAHPGYDAEKQRQYRAAFAEKHISTCKMCGAQFHAYRASYCSPECLRKARMLSSKEFAEIKRQEEKREAFCNLVQYVADSGIKDILATIPRSDEACFLGLQSYIRRNNLLEHLQSIPRQ